MCALAGLWLASLISGARAIATSTRPTKTFFRRVSFDKVEFGGSLSIDSTLSGVDARRFSEFLTPSRVVAAAWDPKMIETLPRSNGEERFRLKQEPFNFAGVVEVETTVDVKVVSSGTALELSSRDIACMATVGLEPPQRLDLEIKLDGALRPQEGRIARLKGSFEFTTGGRLFGPLLFVPDPVLSAAATAVNTGILRYARDRFVSGIVDDFNKWNSRAGSPP